MSFPVHTVDVLNGSSPLSNPDRLKVGVLESVPTPAGAAAGAAVTVNVTMELPGTGYAVQATPNQDATAFVTAKTSTGFTVTLNPRLATATLAAGTVDILVTA